MLLSITKLGGYAIKLVKALSPTVTMLIVGWVGFAMLSARLETQQKKLYAVTQNQISEFRHIADGIAQAKTRIVEKHTLKTQVKELPPEVRAELKRLNAKVEALLKAQIIVPAVDGSGNATHKTPLSWAFEEPKVLSVKFTLKNVPDSEIDSLRGLAGAFDYHIDPVPLDLSITKGVYKHDGVSGLQEWFVTAKDARTGDPLAVKSFDVTVPNLYRKKHWWQKWYITVPAGVLAGMAVK